MTAGSRTAIRQSRIRQARVHYRQRRRRAARYRAGRRHARTDLAGRRFSIIYSSSQGSTVLYPPTLNLRVVAVNGTGDRARPSGTSRTSNPTSSHQASPPLESAETRTSGEFLLTVSPWTTSCRCASLVRPASRSFLDQPDESEAVYLSDSGGHGNLWVTSTDGSGAAGHLREIPACRLGSRCGLRRAIRSRSSSPRAASLANGS